MHSDVRRILARPKFLRKISLVSGKFSDFVTLDNYFYFNTFNMLSRFQGALGFRATTCFRVVLAAPPQVAGILRMFYDPIDSKDVSSLISNYDGAWRSVDYTAASQLPGVDLNFEDATAVDFKIPFTSFMKFMPLVSKGDTVWLGTFNILDYLPVRFVEGTTEPTITLYTWLEDIELFGSTSIENTTIFAQSGEPEDIEPNGPFSGPLYKTSKVASMVSKYVPSLSSLMTPVAWATRLSSEAVAAFGYSKPLDNKPFVRMIEFKNHYNNNCDGPDASLNMGLFQDNELKITNTIGGVDADEMSVSYLMSKYSAIARLNLGVTDVERVYSVQLCPMSLYRQTLTNASSVTLPLDVPPLTANGVRPNGEVYTPSIPFWLGTMFLKYRGSFKFRVKANKTRFHGGRLMLVFNPYTKGVADNEFLIPGTEVAGIERLSQYAHSVLWDLRESNVCELECPWISNSEYLNRYVPYGSFSIHVVDNITVPQNVHQGLDLIIEVAGNDFDFEHPDLDNFIVNPRDDHRSLDTSYAITPQSGDVSELCMGERVTSLKQLISRSEYYVLSAVGDVPPSKGTYKWVIANPWYAPLQTFGRAQLTDNLVQGYHLKRTIPMITAAYAFARGGTCYQVLGPVTTKICRLGMIGDNDIENNFGNNSTIVEPSSNSLNVKVPFYAETTKVPTNPCTQPVVTQFGTYKPIAPLMSLPVARMHNNTASTTSLLSIRAADDAQLGFFLCAPRLVYVDTAFNNGDILNSGAFGGAYPQTAT